MHKGPRQSQGPLETSGIYFYFQNAKSLLNQAKYTTIHVRNTTLLNIFTAVGRGGSVKVQMRDLPQTNTC